MKLTCRLCDWTGEIQKLMDGGCPDCGSLDVIRESFTETRHHDIGLGHFTYEACKDMNIRFAHAMLAARRDGKERFSVGVIVDHTPLFPTYFSRQSKWSGIGSSAAMCAEEMSDRESGKHAPGNIGGGW